MNNWLRIPSGGAGETVGSPVACRSGVGSVQRVHTSVESSPAHVENDRSENVLEDGVCTRRRQKVPQMPLVRGQLTHECASPQWEAGRTYRPGCSDRACAHRALQQCE